MNFLKVNDSHLLTLCENIASVEVSAVNLGRIYKIQDCEGGFEIKVNTGRDVNDAYIYTTIRKVKTKAEASCFCETNLGLAWGVVAKTKDGESYTIKEHITYDEACDYIRELYKKHKVFMKSDKEEICTELYEAVKEYYKTDDRSLMYLKINNIIDKYF